MMDKHVDLANVLSSTPHGEPAWPQYRSETMHRVAGLIKSGSVFDYSGSQEIKELELFFAARFAARRALSFNSGTSALFAAFAALGLGPGDDVVVPDWTFLATVSPLLWLGANPILADCGVDSPNLTAQSVEEAMTPNTRAVVLTHLFGEAADSAGIAAVARRGGAALIEDCSHAHASRLDDAELGRHADAAIFSIGARKLISGGHGGVLVTNRDDLYELALLIGHSKPRTRSELGAGPLQTHAEFALGGNLRLSPISAVLALDHAERIDELSRVRTFAAVLFDDALGPQLTRLTSGHGRNGTFFDYVYMVQPGEHLDERSAWAARLSTASILVSPPATRPLHRVLDAIATSRHVVSGPIGDSLAGLAIERGDSSFPNASSLHDRSLSIPAERFTTSVEYAHVVSQHFARAVQNGYEL